MNLYRPCGGAYQCNGEKGEVCKEYWEGPNSGTKK